MSQNYNGIISNLHMFVFICFLAFATLLSCIRECNCVKKVNGEVTYTEVVKQRGSCKELNERAEIFDLVTEYTCEKK